MRNIDEYLNDTDLDQKKQDTGLYQHRDINNYYRVTSILSPFSGLEYIPKEILENAGRRGTKVHEICTAIMEGMGLPSLEPEIEGYINSFNQWNDDKTFIEKPPRLFCDAHMITGEVDGIYKDSNGDLILIDFKTPLKESKSWSYQASAYSYLCKLNGYPINRIEFVQLFKDGKVAKVYQYEEDFDSFLCCLNMYKTFFKNKKRDDSHLDYI